MNAWMIGMSYAGTAAACSAWAAEWARRKGLDSKAWSAAGAAAGPFALAVLSLKTPEAALCPHCLQPMRFEQRYCPHCRAAERAAMAAEAPSLAVPVRRAGDALLVHGYFEPSPAAA